MDGVVTTGGVTGSGAVGTLEQPAIYASPSAVAALGHPKLATVTSPFGMITATLAVIFVPVFFVVVMKLVQRFTKPH